jgi:hypothetical protein
MWKDLCRASCIDTEEEVNRIDVERRGGGGFIYTFTARLSPWGVHKPVATSLLRDEEVTD